LLQKDSPGTSVRSEADECKANKTDGSYKAKAYNTCRAPQVTYHDFRGAGHVTGQASVGRRP